jgi:hypothetical protein
MTLITSYCHAQVGWTAETGKVHYTDGNVGIGTTSPGFKLEVVGNGTLLKNLGTTSYTTLRLYNDQNNLFRALEIDYSGSAYNGPLAYGGPSGESGSIATTGAYPLSFGTNNTSRMVIAGGGNIGIGTVNPSDQFEVANGNRKVGINTVIDGTTSGGAISISRTDGIRTMFIGESTDDEPVIYGGGGGVQMRFVSGNGSSSGFGFYINNNTTTAFSSRSSLSNQVMKIDGNGNVGIGTDAPDAKLAVKGHIHTQEVRVDLTGAVAPDYVFEPTYNLLPLSEVETYIKANKHLPEVPSAKQMEEEGLNLKEMNLLLLKKVEELTLHLIEMKKENESLRLRDEQHDRQIKELIKEMGYEKKSTVREK